MNSNAESLLKKIGDLPDLSVKNIKCHNENLTLIFLKSMIDENYLIEGIMRPIMDYNIKLVRKEFDEPISLEMLKSQILSTSSIEILSDEDKIKEAVFSNKVLIFLGEEKNCLAVDIEKYPVRLPSEPPTSAVVKGPREGFVEDIKTNLTLLRRRLASDKFKIIDLKVGKYSQTRISIVYLDGVAKKHIVNSVKNKISKINIDGIVDSYYILKFLEPKKHSMFKQVGSSEKPDIVASKMLEGRVAVIVDNSPIVITLPFIFLEDLQSSNDYYSSNHYASFMRFIRLFGIFMSIIVPGFYLTLRFYHYNIMPYKSLITIGNSTQNLPLTPFLEIVFILALFQLLYEVSLRLPQYLGIATSIVGALILGDTGVKAGLISPPGVMIVALSMIAIYTVPEQADQLNLLRVVFIILGGGLGIFGIVAGIVFILSYLNSLGNYGSPYFAPYAPSIKNDMKDALFKVPIIDMKTRPEAITNRNKVRMKR